MTNDQELENSGDNTMIEKITKFQMRSGEIVRGKRLEKALGEVADHQIRLAHAIRKEDAYAKHVSELEKDHYLRESLNSAERIRTGEERFSYTIYDLLDGYLSRDTKEESDSKQPE